MLKEESFKRLKIYLILPKDRLIKQLIISQVFYKFLWNRLKKYINTLQKRLNFKNWSPYMVPDASKSSLGLEYFCFEGDGLWRMSDQELIELGKKEIGQIGLVDPSKVVDGCVVRMPKAYPVYDDEYQKNVEIIRNWLARLENFQVAGRNGMHKYNNQDHSMMTAFLAARNIMGQGPFDPWCVNTDAEYHEEKAVDQTAADTAGRAVPRKLATAE